MHTTRLLNVFEYSKYADWLKSQDTDTLSIYFGYPANAESVDKLVDSIMHDPLNHYFVVAENANLEWIGTIHIAVCAGDTVEFGIMVDSEYRGSGVGSKMIEAAILWARNRRLVNLYMHCLSRNKPIQHLCKKYGLQVTTEYGESETRVTLPQPTIGTYGEEIVNRNFNALQRLSNGHFHSLCQFLPG